MRLRSAFSDFQGRAQFLFVNPSGGEGLSFSVEPPKQDAIKRKALIVIKARAETKEAGFPSGIQNEVVFMEINRPILDNLYNICYVSARSARPLPRPRRLALRRPSESV